MTVLVPNASEEKRQQLPGGGVRVALSWEPEHMHVVRETPAPVREPDHEADGATAGENVENTEGG